MAGHVLAIETSNPTASGDEPGAGVALAPLGSDGAPGPVEIEMLAPTGRHDDDLMPAIDRVTRRCGIRPGDLAKIVVSVGPGGFTGLRIAVTTAKLLAEATGALVVPVPSALVGAHASLTGRVEGVVCLASKRGTTHATRVRATGEHEVLGIIGPEALDGLAGLRLVADGFLPPEIRGAAGELGMEMVVLRLTPGSCLAVGVGLGSVDPVGLVPIYPREPEAVTRWRERGPGGSQIPQGP